MKVTVKESCKKVKNKRKLSRNLSKKAITQKNKQETEHGKNCYKELSDNKQENLQEFALNYYLKLKAK